MEVNHEHLPNNIEDCEIILAMREAKPHNLVEPTSHPEPPVSLQDLDPRPTLTDNIMVMVAKEFEYVESLVGCKNGFLFGEKKNTNLYDTIDQQIVPQAYWPVWQSIAAGSSRRCQNLKIFLEKMLATKSKIFLREAFKLYFSCIEWLLYVENKFRRPQLTQKQFVEFSKVFARRFLYKNLRETEYNQFLHLDQDLVNLGLLSREIEVKEVTQFQNNFHAHYARWKRQFQHYIQVTFYCICVEFYDMKVNYLYEGYYKNTEFDTQRNVPKLKVNRN